MAVYAGEVANPLDRGQKITVRDFTFVVPELVLGDREQFDDDGTFEKIEDLWAELSAIKVPAGETLTKAHLKKIREINRQAAVLTAKVVVIAMKRNYPDIDDAFVKKEFSGTRLMEAYRAATGIVLKKDEEAAGTTSGE